MIVDLEAILRQVKCAEFLETVNAFSRIYIALFVCVEAEQRRSKKMTPPRGRDEIGEIVPCPVWLFRNRQFSDLCAARVAGSFAWRGHVCTVVFNMF